MQERFSVKKGLKGCIDMKDQFRYLLLVMLCIVNLLLGVYNLTSLYNLKDTQSMYRMERYEIIRINDNNYFVYDKETGKVWRKYVEESAGPTDFEEIELPN